MISAWVQSGVACAEFQEVGVSPPPILLWCPTCAVPVELLVHPAHVRSGVAGIAIPAAVDPVTMSC
jgi:hypothetical protein